jgi:hypothetical protein
VLKTDSKLQTCTVFISYSFERSPLKCTMRDLIHFTGSFITKFGCSVLSDSTCGDIINANLNKIRIERIMLMVVSDSPGPHFESALPAMRSTFGEELHITSDLEQRQPFAMIGYSGFNDVSWRESKILPVSSGQSVIKSAVPLLRG